MTIADAGHAIRTGRTTCRALIDAHLDTIARDNDRLNAFITVDAEGARAAADARDRDLAQGIDCGPLHGIPISIKDIIDQAGVVTTAASHVLDDRIAPHDAPVVSRLVEAGAVIIGRVNLHQFALGTTSEDSAYGSVRNPHDTARVAGGSSGGSAAAVAAGLGLGSIGTDTGGSIRVPAAVCGVVGLKGSLGEVPTDGVIPLSTTLDHVGPLANSVQDAAWLWQVIASRPMSTIIPASLSDVTFGRLPGYFDEVLSPEVRTAERSAIATLREHGAAFATLPQVTDAEAIGATYADIVLAEGAHWHGDRLDTRTAGYLPLVHARLSHGRTITATTYIEALAQCRRYRDAVDRLFDACDALLLPTLPIVAPRIGEHEISVDGAAPRPVRAVMLRLTQLFNLSGHPAISLPIATPGLPVGLQIVGRRGDTAGLLRVAAAVESALGPASAR